METIYKGSPYSANVISSVEFSTAFLFSIATRQKAELDVEKETSHYKITLTETQTKELGVGVYNIELYDENGIVGYKENYAKVTPTPNDIISLIINKNELKIQLNGIDAAVKDISKYASDFGTSIASNLGCGSRNSIFYDFKIIDDISGTEISHILPMMDGDTPILYDIVLNEKIEIPEVFTLTPVFK